MKLLMNPGQVQMCCNIETMPMYLCYIFCEGDFYADPTLLLPTMADKKNLAKVYDAVSAK